MLSSSHTEARCWGHGWSLSSRGESRSSVCLHWTGRAWEAASLVLRARWPQSSMPAVYMNNQRSQASGCYSPAIKGRKPKVLQEAELKYHLTPREKEGSPPPPCPSWLTRQSIQSQLVNSGLTLPAQF